MPIKVLDAALDNKCKTWRRGSPKDGKESFIQYVHLWCSCHLMPNGVTLMFYLPDLPAHGQHLCWLWWSPSGF